MVMSIDTPMLTRFDRIDNLEEMSRALQDAEMRPGRLVFLVEESEEIPYEVLLSKVLPLIFNSIPLVSSDHQEEKEKLCKNAQAIGKKMDELSSQLDRSLGEILKDAFSTMCCCGCYCPWGNRACQEDSLNTLIRKFFTSKDLI